MSFHYRTSDILVRQFEDVSIDFERCDEISFFYYMTFYWLNSPSVSHNVRIKKWMIYNTMNSIWKPIPPLFPHRLIPLSFKKKSRLSPAWVSHLSQGPSENHFLMFIYIWTKLTHTRDVKPVWHHRSRHRALWSLVGWTSEISNFCRHKEV